MSAKKRLKLPYFDSHAHLCEDEILSQIDAVMQRAQAANVTRILNICTSPQTLREGLSLQKKFPGVLNAGATTPHDVEKEGEQAFSIFEEAAKQGLIAAIGETGLEYFQKDLDRAIQKRFLVRYLHLAQECGLPVIFHCREAFPDLFSITDIEYSKKAPAILHCFTGNMHEAEQVLSRGWYLSLSGIVTFKKTEALREVAKIIPLNQLLIETDAPYLAPQTKRGKLNEPAYLIETAKILADVKKIPIEDLGIATFQNALNILSTS